MMWRYHPQKHLVRSNPEIKNYRSKAELDIDGNFAGRGDHPETVFFKEIKQLRDAGYRLEGDYMVPPSTK